MIGFHGTYDISVKEDGGVENLQWLELTFWMDKETGGSETTLCVYAKADTNAAQKLKLIRDAILNWAPQPPPEGSP